MVHNTEIAILGEALPDFAKSELLAVTGLQINERAVSMSGLMRAYYSLPQAPPERQIIRANLASTTAAKIEAFYKAAYSEAGSRKGTFDCFSFAHYTAGLTDSPFYSTPELSQAHREEYSASTTDLQPGRAYNMVDRNTPLHALLAISPIMTLSALGKSMPLAVGTMEQLQSIYPADQLWLQVKSQVQPLPLGRLF